MLGLGNRIAATVLTKVEITIFKTMPTGTSVPGFKIVLTNARISQMDATYDPGADPSAVEKLELVYEKFEWTDILTGTTRIIP